MNRNEKEQFLEINKMIFEGNERLLDRDICSAEEIYDRLMDQYKDLPSDVKDRIFNDAMDLRNRILKAKKSQPRQQYDFFRLYDGRVIKDLHHLVYILDTISDINWQFHVNSVRNDLYNWIRYRLKNKELAALIDGLIDKEDIKLVILRYLLMKDFKIE